MAGLDVFNDTYFLSYCQNLYDADNTYDSEQTDRLDRHRHLDPESARFLASLVMMQKPKEVLEIGTSTGFSTLWLAYGLRHHSHAHFISLDIEKSRSDIAKRHLQAVGLSDLVDIRVQDALEFLTQNRKTFDFVFLDAERQFYCDYTEDLHRALTIGGVLVVDNVLSHREEVCQFLAAFTDDNRYICHTLEIGSGLFMAMRQEP